MVRLKELVESGVSPLSKFQYQHGAIKGSFATRGRITFPYFNTSMVRLKVRITGVTDFTANHFNTSMVRLKEYEDGTIMEYEAISIPAWCD